MTPDEAVRAMAERLKAVDWKRRGDKSWSKAALLKEYFRRAARWQRAYGCEASVPFYDIAACVDPGVRADPRVADEVIGKIGPGNRSVPRVVPFILHWAALRATPGVELPGDLEDPFEPLVLLFERGGGFHTENGEVNLEYVAVRMAGWQDRADNPPPISLAADELDALDRDGAAAQRGDAG
ncbi:hypothetical protein Ade02nite_73400 [Paractinoplanes deccanensis]|uniref:Uncharacterized protein n=1 Tax=Paractinoplanes deccanensis TaxID=113561 RepID=A0ABQ3YFD2_9ACTN|nr:hypothetical protein [Actinoplanes deccanensis]GID78699.1 hypothetical protein Ade02nite_73400 [Actinoplanes deccanensis]